MPQARDHLRMQITRTSAGLAASAPTRPVAGVTYWASRNLRSVSTGTTVADPGEAAVPALATAASLSTTMPNRRPWESRAAAPLKPGGGSGWVASPVRRDGRGETALPPAWDCG